MNRIGIEDFIFYPAYPVHSCYLLLSPSGPLAVASFSFDGAHAAGAECLGVVAAEKIKRGRAVGRINSRPDNLRWGLPKRMADTKEDAVGRARTDLAGRLGVPEAEIGEDSVEEADFPNTALGAPLRGEMSGMMIATGWRIRLAARGQTYEYRADRNQLRLYDFRGANYKI